MWLFIGNSILSQQEMTGLSVDVGASDEALNWKLLGDRQAANGHRAFSKKPNEFVSPSIVRVREKSIESRRMRIFHNSDIGFCQKPHFSR